MERKHKCFSCKHFAFTDGDPLCSQMWSLCNPNEHNDCKLYVNMLDGCDITKQTILKAKQDLINLQQNMWNDYIKTLEKFSFK